MLLILNDSENVKKIEVIFLCDLKVINSYDYICVLWYFENVIWI